MLASGLTSELLMTGAGETLDAMTIDSAVVCGNSNQVRDHPVT